jgi:glycerol-3-phosphate dehydrogenase
MPERLGLELVLDGMAAHPGSLALNHVALDGVAGGRLVFRDRIGGGLHTVGADVVINAAGAHIDAVNARLGLATAYIGGQKGSHLVVANERLRAAIGDNLVYFGAADGRIGLLYPFMGHVLVGSTDIPVASPDDPVCEDRERRYMLDTVAEIFPDIHVADEEVVYTYSGVRPLPRSDGHDPGAVSRDHSIREDRLAPGVPVLSLIGGKWTTFRGFAEEASDRALERLGRVRRLSTRLVPIGGGRDYPTDDRSRQAALAALREAVESGARAETLFDRYGTKAGEIARWCAARQDRPLETVPDYSRGEIGFLAAREAVRRLADLIFRRTDIALSGRLRRDVVAEVGEVAAAELGWERERLADEIEDVLAIAVRKHRIRQDALQAA